MILAPQVLLAQLDRLDSKEPQDQMVIRDLQEILDLLDLLAK